MRHEVTRRVIGTLVVAALAAQPALAGTAAWAASTAGSTTPAAGSGSPYESVAEVPEDEDIAALQAGEDYEAGEVLVCFEEGVDERAALEVLDDAVTVSGDADEVGDGSLITQVEGSASVAQAVEELSAEPGVAWAQPNFIYTTADDEVDGDPAGVAATGSEDATAVTGVDGTLTAAAVSVNDPDASRQWYLQDCSLYDAWSVARGSDAGVAVAVIDTGCDVSHPDLAANVVATHNAVDGGSDVTDEAGHGTGVCGVISAVANNGVGIAGTSYNAKVVPVKASLDTSADKNTFTSRTVADAISWVVDNASAYDIHVINLSLSAPATSETQRMERAIDEAVDKAYDAGILVVCAAGNAEPGHSVPYASIPGDYAKCLSVTNLTDGHVLNSSSNYNVSGTRAKDLCAPGTGIYTCAAGGGYQVMGGTSFAAPVVSGAAALTYAADPSLDAAEVTEILQGTATDLGTSGWDETYGYGEVNASAAVERAKEGASEVEVLRLYNPWTGEHLYTTDASEYASLPSLGWRQEGLAWRASSWSGTAVLRLYNPYSGDHLYTTSAAEYASLPSLGWRQEGESFRAPSSGVEVLRLYNPYEQVGTHLYTTDASEYASLATVGWQQEGVAWHGLAG